MSEKKKYYVSLAASEISQIKFGNNDEFTIYATEEDVRKLREMMNDMRDADIGTFWRAHIPFMHYHNDKANDKYDQAITDAFQLLYKIGDEETKNHIEEIGVLSDKSIKTEN